MQLLLSAAASTMNKNTKQEYRVLARKYRPQTFGNLIGQETLVQTLKNSIINNRIAHAYLLTGVRGVGKTYNGKIDSDELY